VEEVVGANFVGRRLGERLVGEGGGGVA